MKKIYLLSLLIFISFADAATTKNDFTFQGEPISPVCIAKFDSSLQHEPVIGTKVAIETCQHTAQATHQNYIGYYFYVNNKNIDDGEYLYQYIGKTKNGIHILRTINNGGGTGNFTDLLFLKLNDKQLTL